MMLLMDPFMYLSMQETSLNQIQLVGTKYLDSLTVPLRLPTQATGNSLYTKKWKSGENYLEDMQAAWNILWRNWLNQLQPFKTI